MATLRPMPSQAVPVVDPKTGLMNPEWRLYFLSREKLGLSNLVGVSTTVPTDGDVLVFDSTTGLWGPGAS